MNNYMEWTDEDINKEIQRRYALSLGYTDLVWYEDLYGMSFGRRMLRSSAHWAGVLPEGQKKAEGQYWNDDTRVEVIPRPHWLSNHVIFTIADDVFGGDWSYTRLYVGTPQSHHIVCVNGLNPSVHIVPQFVCRTYNASRERAICNALLYFSDEFKEGKL